LQHQRQHLSSDFRPGSARLLDNGSYTTLDVPGASYTEAHGINASGQIVGISDAGAFLLDNGSYTTFAALTFHSYAYSINASSQIVGDYYDGSRDHGFLFDQGSYTTLDPPGSTHTEAYGINDSGQIVGWYQDASGWHGFLATPVP
jgi:uncharacterized membrane protein